jgi:hypothetical protein
LIGVPTLPWQTVVVTDSKQEVSSSSYNVALDQGAQAKRKWIEPLTALIMALATVGTAWCSYESASWTRRGNGLMNECNSLERQAGLLRIQGMEAASIHVAMFMQLLAARQAGNEKLASFYAERFPPDMRKAYDSWLAQRPFENSDADPHPFVPNLYQTRGTQEAAKATADAASKVQEARKAGNVSGQYLANTVMFAAVLFFANAAGKFEQARVRLVSFVFAIGVFTFAVARIAMLPQ